MLDNSDGNQREALLTDKQWRAVVLHDRLLGIGGFLLALAIFGVRLVTSVPAITMANGGEHSNQKRAVRR